MHVLSTRPSEKIVLPETKTTIEVVAIQSGTVRIGITAPDDVPVLRQEAPEATPAAAPVSDLPALKRLMEKRLDIARTGLNEARQLLRAGLEADARVILEKVDEDLHLLRRRIHREMDDVETLTCGL